MGSKVYNITDFPNDKYNAAVLENAIRNAGISVNYQYFNHDGESGDIEFFFDGELTTGDESLLDAVVAAHQGADFSEFPANSEAIAEDSDDSGTEQIATSITDILPAPGKYQISWYMEISTTSYTGSHLARGLFKIIKNSNPTEQGKSHTALNAYVSMSGSYDLVVNPEDAGDVYSFGLFYQRVGSSGNAAKRQRARLSIIKTG